MAGIDLIDGLLESLARADGPAAGLAELVVSHVLGLPINSLVDADELTAGIMLALRSDGSAAIVDRHILPVVEAERARAGESGEKLGDLVPDDVIEAIEKRTKRPVALPDGFGRDIVRPAFVTGLVTGVLQDTLEAFVAKLPIPGGGGGRRSDKAHSDKPRSGKRRGLLGGLGRAVQENTRRTTAEFARQSAGKMRGVVEQRLRTPENRRELEAMRRRAIDAVLALPIAELHALADDPGPSEIAQWALRVLEHNAARPEVEAAIQMHVGAVLEREGERTVSQMLTEQGLLESVRAGALDRVRAEIVKLASSAGLREWLEGWVSGQALE